MQKWEYIVVTADDTGDKVRYVNGKELRDWQRGPDLYAYLNTLGSQGWELVAAPYTDIGYGVNAHLGATDHHIRELTRRFIFKRPLP